MAGFPWHERGDRRAILGVIALVVLLSTVVFGTSAGAGERVAGYVVTVDGHAYRQGLRESQGTPLEVRRRVFDGDQLTTQAESRAQLSLRGDVLFVLGPDSQLELSAPSRAARGQVLRMGPGFFRLMVPVGAREAHVLVMTPTAVTAVRGAEILGQVEEKNTAIVVIRGEAEVRGTGKGGTVKVEAGQATDVADGQDPTEPVEWDKERLKRLREVTAVKLFW